MRRIFLRPWQVFLYELGWRLAVSFGRGGNTLEASRDDED